VSGHTLRRERTTAKAPPPITTTAAAAPRIAHIVLPSDDFELGPVAEVWPPEVAFEGSDEFDVEAEGEGDAPAAFSLLRGSLLAAPGL
jgi:hypothetical protein